MPRKKTAEAPKAPDGRELYSISRLAAEAGLDRRTVTGRLKQVDSDGEIRNHGAYTLKTAGPHLWGGLKASSDGTVPTDPAARKTFYQSEEARLKVEAAIGNLIPAEEVREGVAEVFKLIALKIDTLADTLERDIGLTPDQMTTARVRILSIKDSLYSELTSKGE